MSSDEYFYLYVLGRILLFLFVLGGTLLFLYVLVMYFTHKPEFFRKKDKK